MQRLSGRAGERLVSVDNHDRLHSLQARVRAGCLQREDPGAQRQWAGSLEGEGSLAAICSLSREPAMYTAAVAV